MTCNHCKGVSGDETQPHCTSPTCPWWECQGCGWINDQHGHSKKREYQA
jgi:hypothetical protein